MPVGQTQDRASSRPAGRAPDLVADADDAGHGHLAEDAEIDLALRGVVVLADAAVADDRAMTERRFDRERAAVGAAGQEKIGATAIAIVGAAASVRSLANRRPISASAGSP